MQDDKPVSNTTDGSVPGYWMNEMSGFLLPAVTAFLMQDPMTDSHIAAMRAYLRQWMAGDWGSDRIEDLRARIDGLTTRLVISAWLSDAIREGIDPLFRFRWIERSPKL